MGLIDSALAAWISFHANMGVELDLFFREGVSNVLLEQSEARIGYELPDDLKELYRKTNGQRTSLDESQEHLNGVVWAPMFGHFYFYSLEKALEEYEVLSQMYLSDPELMESEWDVRGDDPVRAVYGDHKRFPFAGDDNGNMYMVDMNPAPNGTVGQVILQGSDQSEIRVLSSSVAQFMVDAASNLDPDSIRHKNHLEPMEPSAGVRRFYFEMDWLERQTTDTDRVKHSTEVESERILKDLRADYNRWLEQHAIVENMPSGHIFDMVRRLVDSALKIGINDFPATKDDVSYLITLILIQRNVTHSSRYKGNDEIVEKTIAELTHFANYQSDRGKWSAENEERVREAIEMVRNPYSDDDTLQVDRLLKR